MLFSCYLNRELQSHLFIFEILVQIFVTPRTSQYKLMKNIHVFIHSQVLYILAIYFWFRFIGFCSIYAIFIPSYIFFLQVTTIRNKRNGHRPKSLPFRMHKCTIQPFLNKMESTMHSCNKSQFKSWSICNHTQGLSSPLPNHPCGDHQKQFVGFHDICRHFR